MSINKAKNLMLVKMLIKRLKLKAKNTGYTEKLTKLLIVKLNSAKLALFYIYLASLSIVPCTGIFSQRSANLRKAVGKLG
jgi:hypothetical protein